MPISLQFARGSSTFDLSTAPYSVGFDFTPPAVNNTYNISGGTSANISGGGSLIGSRANDRALSFTVRIMATNINEAGSYVRRLAGFVKAQTNDTLYLDYREDTSIPVPLWGQFGAPLRYEVVTCDVGNIDENYGLSGARAFFVTVTMEIKPLAVGLRQKLINATGGLFEDTYGTADGTARGLGISESTTNKMTNPVFGSSTYITGWTSSVETVTKNTDSRYVLPGLLQSAKVIAIGANNVFYQVINAGNTNKHSFSAYVMLPDGGTPTNADVLIWYNTALSTTFKNLGNGLWLAYADNVSGINAATLTGVVVLSGRTCYLLGYQMEEKAYHTPLSYGDLLGNSWSGTAHASTSIRAAAVCQVARTDDYLSMAQGAVNVIWNPYYANTFGAVEYFFAVVKTDFTVYSLQAYFQQADDKFYLTDGVNTISTAAQTFAAGDVIVLTFVWGPAGLAIYKNGVSAASGVTYTAPAVVNSALLAIGHANTGAQNNGTLLGFDVYATQLTQTQVTAIYAAASAIVDGGGRVSTIPWLWTKDGDGIVDNCDDSTRDNWCVAGGVPGNIQADTLFNMKLSSARQLYISNLHTKTFINPTLYLYKELSGTADANSSGGAYLTQFGDAAVGQLLNAAAMIELAGKEFAAVSRVKAAAAGVYLSAYSQFGTLGVSSAGALGINTTDFSLIVSKFLGFQDFAKVLQSGDIVPNSPQIGASFVCTSSCNIYIDYVSPLFRPCAKITASSTGVILTGADITDYSTTGNLLTAGGIAFTGDVVELFPEKNNTLMSYMGNSTSTSVITDTLTHAISVTPRYALL
jgi:hypothetical protein